MERRKLLILLVPGAGIEPARPEGREILSPLQIPNLLIVSVFRSHKWPEMRSFDCNAYQLRTTRAKKPHAKRAPSKPYDHLIKRSFSETGDSVRYSNTYSGGSHG